nr:zinc knuckle CX2CX4HX4C [Tanacetum cinerariifolium]
MNSGSHSFASILHNKETKKTVKVSVMCNEEKVAGVVVAIPLEVVKETSSFFNNTLFGYFIGKRLAFPLVESYVKNTWEKIRVGMNDAITWELPESVVVAIPYLDCMGHSLETIDVEYE